MEDQVRDAILEGTGDLYLIRLIELVLDEKESSRPLYRNGLEEPRLFRLFRGWVLGGFEELARMRKGMQVP